MACVVLPQSKPLEYFERGVFKGDDTFSVDRLVASCQPRVMPALPSAGRVLVPYFDSPDDCVNDTLTKVDPARKRKKSGKKAAAAGVCTTSPQDNSPVKPVSKHAAQKHTSSQTGNGTSQAGNGNKHCVSDPPVAELRHHCKSPNSVVSKELKSWAGPSYYISPPPEHLPMPTSFLLAV